MKPLNFIFFLLLFVVTQFSVFSQKNNFLKLDSLADLCENQLNQYRVDKDKKKLIQLNSYKETYKSYLQAEKDSIKYANYFLIESKIHAYAYKNLPKGEEFVKKSIDLFKREKDTLRLVDAYIYEATMYLNFGNVILNYLKLEELYQKFGNYSLDVRYEIFWRLVSTMFENFDRNIIDVNKHLNELKKIQIELLEKSKIREYIHISLLLAEYHVYPISTITILDEIELLDLTFKEKCWKNNIRAQKLWDLGAKKKAIDILSSQDKKLTASNLKSKLTPKNSIIIKFSHQNTLILLIKYNILIGNYTLVQKYLNKYYQIFSEEGNDLLYRKMIGVLSDYYYKIGEFEKGYQFLLKKKEFDKDLFDLSIDFISRNMEQKKNLKIAADRTSYLKERYQARNDKIKIRNNLLIITLVFLLFLGYLLLIYFKLVNNQKLNFNKINSITSELEAVIEKNKENKMRLVEINDEVVNLLEKNENILFMKQLKISLFNESIIKATKQTTKLIESVSVVEKSEINSIKNVLVSSLQEEEIWQEIKFKFEVSNPNFFEKLRAIHPQLTENELIHCSYVVSEIKSKEVAQFINVSPRSVETCRYRIKKKLNLKNEDCLLEFLKSI